MAGPEILSESSELTARISVHYASTCFVLSDVATPAFCPPGIANRAQFIVINIRLKCIIFSETYKSSGLCRIFISIRKHNYLLMNVRKHVSFFSSDHVHLHTRISISLDQSSSAYSIFSVFAY